MIEEVEKGTNITPKKKKKKSKKKYPKKSILEALSIAKSIVNNNAGEPFNRLTLAKSLETTPNSSKFRTLITSSSKFGLTIGGYQAEKIAITELGRSIVQYTSKEEYYTGLKNALFNIPFYKEFYSKFDTNRFPVKKILKNTLNREFNIPIESTDQCYNLIIKNADELGIIDEIGGKNYINLTNLSYQKILDSERKIDEKIDPGVILEKKRMEEIIPENNVEPLKNECRITTPKVFIAHSKNKKILEQIKDILEFGKFLYVIAEDVQTTAVPIPDKIFKLMKECNCAIINVSADEQENLSGNSYKINENVLIEIGASFLAYDQKIILLVDKRIKLPSNLQGLNLCEYEGDLLPWNTVKKLQLSLKNFEFSTDK